MHTFSLGSDRDEEALHGISAATGDTFSLLSDALPPCIAGLRSVTARDVCIEVDCRCQYPEIGITAIKSGRYKNIITTTDGEPAWVGVGDLYADEERRFLFLFDVRRIGDANRNRTLLCKVRCEQGFTSRPGSAGNRKNFPFPELSGIGNRQNFSENFAQI